MSIPGSSLDLPLGSLTIRDADPEETRTLAARPHVDSLTLPDELLAEIFSYGSSGVEDYRDADVIAPNATRAQAAFLVAAVCQRWRAAALAASRLWHYILIPRFSVNARSSYSNRVCSYLDVVLLRSRSVPIDIMFQYVEDVAPPDEFGPIFSALREHQYRWRRFLARVRGRLPIVALLECLQGPTPLLRTLQLTQQRDSLCWGYAVDDMDSVHLDGRSSEPPISQPILSDAPSLIWVSIVNIPDIIRSTIISPAARPQGLEYFADRQNPAIWNMLRGNTQLEQLTLGTWPTDGAADRVEPIELQQVFRLWLTQGAFQLVANQPDLLVLPKLDTLTMVHSELRGMESFLVRVQSTLTFLDLRHVDSLDAADIEVLAAMPYIAQLQLGEATLPDLWLERLCHVPSSLKNWQKLMWRWLFNFTLYSCKVESVELRRLVDLAKMRRVAQTDETKPTWRQVFFRLTDNEVPQDQLDEIKALPGITVVV